MLPLHLPLLQGERRQGEALSQEVVEHHPVEQVPSLLEEEELPHLEVAGEHSLQQQQHLEVEVGEKKREHLHQEGSK